MKLAAILFATIAATAQVSLERVPNGGIQPQAAVDARGRIHLIYFSGDPQAGDVFYVRSGDGGEHFSAPLRVNSVPASAVAVGNIRGAHLAIGRNGRVHVAWAAPKGAGMMYTRLNDSETAFERERNVASTCPLDGGTVAADAAGHVYVVWHAPGPEIKDEAHRRVWLARSDDDGVTFSPERAVNDPGTGVCGCCGSAAVTGLDGTLFSLFRSATDTVHRDMYVLASHDGGQTFTSKKLDEWQVGYCVMSSAAMITAPTGTLAAWETRDQIRLGDPAGAIATAPGEANKRKYPALAMDRNLNVLLAWTEGMGWKKGGSLAWQLYGRDLHPIGDVERAPGVPAWSLVAAVARPGGGFVIFY